ncbi:helix-turn-helix domain-containing protein [Piscirickettsia litoralis]|uniref:Insertion element IS150 protein InsJ-like helix-turn-helix domain-containing protein n=1 Tax=Piscirickettsia litoralis TaxID=1891921 RepID=A0ABX2ZXI0_9GAMM|nr:helix-turn-helix domain-containing protein [Piscirickettsia litoralis]ODN41322.1 hypothetical protein BGC07_17335 [Piscirickettsia litoralis]
MPAAYSTDLRMKAVEAYKKGKYHQAEIAEQFGISIATLNRYWRAYNAHGDLSPKKYHHGRHAVLSGNNLNDVAKLIANKPDATIAELCEVYNQTHEIPVGRSMMHRACQKLKANYKKKSKRASQQQTDRVKKA